MPSIGDFEPFGTREEAVKAALKLAYRSSETVPINSRETSATGLKLGDRFVTILEVLQLVATPPLTGRQQLIIQLIMRDDLTNAQAAERLDMDREILIQEKNHAIQTMIRLIWQDPTYTTVKHRSAATANIR